MDQDFIAILIVQYLTTSIMMWSPFTVTDKIQFWRPLARMLATLGVLIPIGALLLSEPQKWPAYYAVFAMCSLSAAALTIIAALMGEIELELDL